MPFCDASETDVSVFVGACNTPLSDLISKCPIDTQVIATGGCITSVCTEFALCNKPPVAVSDNVSEANMETTISLNGANSTDEDGTIVSYLWEQIDSSGAVVTLATPTAMTTDLTLPEVTEDTTITIQLTVTDDDGATDVTTTDIVIKFVSCCDKLDVILSAGTGTLTVNASGDAEFI